MILHRGVGKSRRSESVRRNMVVSRAVYDMERAMKTAVDKIVDTAFITGDFYQPSLNEMNIIADQFYGDVIRQAFYQCQEDKKAMFAKRSTKKKLAKGPKGIPKKLEDLDQIFHDKKYFKAIMRRSRKMSDRLKKQYLQKLKKQFNEIIPKIREGEVSAKSAKAHMIKAWDASKSRVDTIFQTETTNYFGKVQVEFFKDDDGIIGFLFEARETSTTTTICHSRHGCVFTKVMTGDFSIEHNTPSCHFGCHSKLIPLANTARNRKLLEDSSRDPRRRKLEPLPDGWR